MYLLVSSYIHSDVHKDINFVSHCLDHPSPYYALLGNTPLPLARAYSAKTKRYII